jgi:hypothetical protein
MDRSILDTWDAQIIERVDRIRSGDAGERVPCTLRMSAGCLEALDQTLNELRKRSQRRSTDARAIGAELVDLRSSAIELAVSGYVDGVRRRQRPRPAATLFRTGNTRRAPAEAIMCLLADELLDDLDELLRDLLGGTAGAGSVTAAELTDARDVVVESAITSWLMLRGYSAIVPAAARRNGWFGAVRLLARRRLRWRQS